MGEERRETAKKKMIDQLERIFNDREGLQKLKRIRKLASPRFFTPHDLEILDALIAEKEGKRR
jgi:hypothetical protein